MESNTRTESYAHLATSCNLLQTSHIFLQAHTEASNSPKIGLLLQKMTVWLTLAEWVSASLTGLRPIVRPGSFSLLSVAPFCESELEETWAWACQLLTWALYLLHDRSMPPSLRQKIHPLGEEEEIHPIPSAAREAMVCLIRGRYVKPALQWLSHIKGEPLSLGIQTGRTQVTFFLLQNSHWELSTRPIPNISGLLFGAVISHSVAVI